MQPYQQRVIEEERELAARAEKLEAFLADDKFLAVPTQEKHLLEAQAGAMGTYLRILRARIAAFA